MMYFITFEGTYWFDNKDASSSFSDHVFISLTLLSISAQIEDYIKAELNTFCNTKYKEFYQQRYLSGFRAGYINVTNILTISKL